MKNKNNLLLILIFCNKFTCNLHSCKINNVYTDFFEGNMPMPHTDWLELSYISYENSKVFDNNLT